MVMFSVRLIVSVMVGYIARPNEDCSLVDVLISCGVFLLSSISTQSTIGTNSYVIIH